MATIYEVAKLAGVSPATVSRVLNGANVSPAKTEAVRKAAKELNFRPNRTARSLRRQESEVIALVIPDIENPYFTELTRGVEDIAQDAGYSVVICNSDSDIAKESRYLQIAVEEQMAGVIVAPASAETTLNEVLSAGLSLVTVDRTTEHDVDGVIMANFDAGRMATAHLLRTHQRVAYIGGPDNIDTSTERAAGWEQAYRDAGLSAPEDLLRFSSFRVHGGRAVMEELLALDAPPDAVVAGNNLIGVGAIQVLTERDLTPPKLGVAVVGSLPFTTLSPSAVTVIKLPARHMGVTAAKMLLERIRGDKQPARTIMLRNEVQVAAPAR